MKSFQNKAKGYRSLQSKKCVHGRRSVQYIKRAQIQKTDQYALRQDRQKTDIVHDKQKKDDLHSKMIRSLVAMNEEYFQNKLKIASDGRPNKLKLKIPSYTGFTIYKRDYTKNGDSKPKTELSPAFKENKIKGDFFDGTTYRNEYNGVQNSQPRLKKEHQQHADAEAPTFHQSQYKHNFLNWGANSSMPSMKPHPCPAVTNLPFQTSTVYSSEFTNKPSLKKQNFKPNSSAMLSNSGLISNQITTPLLYVTTNNMFYDKKTNSKECNLKLKTNTLAVSGNCFKGKTEYQSQFITTQSFGGSDSAPKKPLGELQNLILNL